MNRFKPLVGLLFVTCFLFATRTGFAQITSSANAVVPTEYSGGPQDEIHVFCGAKGELNASLTANSPGGESGNFDWAKFNGTGFDTFRSETGQVSSTITSLEDGCYRVTVTLASGIHIYTAWVFNNYIEVTAEIPTSDCNLFTLAGTVNSPKLIYTDLTTGAPKELANSYAVSWSVDNKVFSSFATQPVYSPPTKDTDYTFEATDRFNCSASEDVKYLSIVTKAAFTYFEEGQVKKSDANKTEAPLTVTFTNTSENGDPGKYEWFIFKDLQKIKDESAAGTLKDSIMEKVVSDNMVFTFEACGTYMVKLVSKKFSENNTVCTDTFYMADYIVADTSFIEAPNVFTPGNADGSNLNETFAIKFFSMKSVKVTIFNRWGKVLHVWESNNVQGFLNTAETVPESVWDGKVGGKYASPGVYYYVVEGIGRDDKRRKQAGFFHLFRDK
jgi:gliding motility-associated-like protein